MEKEEEVEGSTFNEATVLENILDILKQGMGATGKDVGRESETGDFQSFKSFKNKGGGEGRVIGGYRSGYRWVANLFIYMYLHSALWFMTHY